MKKKYEECWLINNAKNNDNYGKIIIIIIKYCRTKSKKEQEKARSDQNIGK